MVARVGLTGGIGSGKSTVAGMFVDLGVPVLDLDLIGRALLHDEPGLVAKLTGVFGSSILAADGRVDRAVLAREAFASKEATARLNAIMHPLIRREEDRWISRQSGDYCIVEASVLIESGGASRMDAVIVVLADLEQRRQRVAARGAMSPAMLENIVARQCDDEARLAVADYVIANSGSLSALRGEVEAIWHRLQQRFAATAKV